MLLARKSQHLAEKVTLPEIGHNQTLAGRVFFADDRLSTDDHPDLPENVAAKGNHFAFFIGESRRGHAS